MQRFYDHLFSQQKNSYYANLSRVLTVTPEQLALLRDVIPMGWVMWGQAKQPSLYVNKSLAKSESSGL